MVFGVDLRGCGPVSVRPEVKRGQPTRRRLRMQLRRTSPRKRGAHLPWSWPAAAARQGQAYVNMDPAER
jgi:hypothetical protein